MAEQLGYISLHRQIKENWMWTEKREFSKLEAWLDILLSVNHSDAEVVIKFKVYKVKRGESIKSLDSWAKSWNWNKSKVRRFLKLLEEQGNITLKNETQTTRITVCKYDSYQTNRNVIETQVKRNRNASETQVTPNNNDNKNNNENITIKSVSSPPDGVDALYFYIAKGYHKMFYDYKGSKSLEDAELGKWVNTIRLLVEVDKVTIPQLIAVKQFLQAGINKQRGVDSFWSDTIYSLNALRKKSKDGVYQFDRIKQDAKKWLTKNPEQEAIVYQAEIKLMERANGQ